MAIWTDVFVLGLVLTNFRLLSSSRLAAMIETMVLQAIALTVIPLTLADHPWPLRLMTLSLVTLTVKGVLLPWLLRRSMRAADVQREIEPFIGYTVSILTGIALLGLAFLIAQPLKAATGPGLASLLPGALFSILTGLLIIVSRRKALTQVVGYLVMENGIYAFGAALAVKEPLLVEMGVLLDVFVAVFVMGITIYQINREFDHIDTDRLSELKD
ncbi:MAG: hydrogenase [Deltaproteobacteria bacterium]|nr:hydrogenase [Deltaproteobacteria bacterium]